MEKNHTDDFIIVYNWMSAEAGLKGVELLVFATIFSFTHGNKWERFYGSNNYLATMAACTRRQAINAVNSLAEKSYIWVQEKDRKRTIICGNRAWINTLKEQDEQTIGVIHMVN